MPIDLQLRIIHATDFLRACPTGELDLPQSRELILKIAAANKPPADRDILLDVRAVRESKLETEELISLVRLMVEHLPSFQRKFALLIAPDAPGYRAQLVEHLADTRGINLEIFRDFEQSMTWLMSSTPFEPRTTGA